MMSLPELKSARLGGVEGQGYAFSLATSGNEGIRGIFYARNTPAEELSSMVDLDAVTFSGVLYKSNRSGSMNEKQVELDVDVTNMTSVAFGDRLDFVEAEGHD